MLVKGAPRVFYHKRFGLPHAAKTLISRGLTLLRVTIRIRYQYNNFAPFNFKMLAVYNDICLYDINVTPPCWAINDLQFCWSKNTSFSLEYSGFEYTVYKERAAECRSQLGLEIPKKVITSSLLHEAASRQVRGGRLSTTDCSFSSSGIGFKLWALL